MHGEVRQHVGHNRKTRLPTTSRLAPSPARRHLSDAVARWDASKVSPHGKEGSGPCCTPESAGLYGNARPATRSDSLEHRPHGRPDGGATLESFGCVLYALVSLVLRLTSDMRSANAVSLSPQTTVRRQSCERWTRLRFCPPYFTYDGQTRSPVRWNNFHSSD